MKKIFVLLLFGFLVTLQAQAQESILNPESRGRKKDDPFYGPMQNGAAPKKAKGAKKVKFSREVSDNRSKANRNRERKKKNRPFPI